MDFLKVAEASDIPPGKMKAFKTGKENVLIANIEGTFHAIANKCPHAHFPLNMGRLDGCVVTCPLHHARFNAETGANVEDAKILFLRLKPKDARCYPVKVENGEVMVGV
ncbi:MAG: Rieske 2Fe-2S domain-containing protein [Cyanobacteria bacterium REEB67]|nr:Rieske 2Fe-2S domain-containing protein [Cyanobacteria bacterium REEB67]